MALRTIGLLTTCCLLLGPSGCARWGFDPPADGGPDGGCRQDTDCESGQTCEQGACVDACAQDSDCPAGQVCDQGRCRAGCQVDADCPGGQVCQAGACQPECQQAADCAPGQTCQQGACVDAGGKVGDPCSGIGDCDLDLVCADGTCHATCTEPSDCSPGTCQLGVCRGAAPGEACLAEADCEPPGTCIDGWCLEPCAQDADCTAGFCHDAMCLDVPKADCRAFIRLRDDFEDDQTGMAWQAWADGGAVVGESGGRLALSPSALGASEAGVRSRRLFDLTASQVTVEVATMVNTAEEAGFMFMLDHPLPREEHLEFKQWGGTLSGMWTQAGDTTFAFQVPWDPVAHRFLRLSEEFGYAVWSTSADGMVFDEQYREPLPIQLKDLRLNLWAGTLSPTSAPGAVRIEAVNGTRLPPSSGRLEVCPVGSISDSFDTSLLRPLWDYAYAQPGTSFQAGGGFITLLPAANQPGYAGLLTGDTFKLREGAVWVSVLEATADDPSADTEFGVMRNGGDDIIKLSKTGSELRFWSIVDNQPTLHGSTAYSPDAHRHWRLRDANGFIHWETSSDTSVWIEQAQADPPFDLKEVQVFMQAGTFDPVPTPGQAVFDNFNVPTM